MAGDRRFESRSLQQRVCELSVPEREDALPALPQSPETPAADGLVQHDQRIRRRFAPLPSCRWRSRRRDQPKSGSWMIARWRRIGWKPAGWGTETTSCIGTTSAAHRRSGPTYSGRDIIAVAHGGNPRRSGAGS